MTLQGRERLRGWRFTVFNMMLGSGHMVVLFNAGAYTALSPHTAGDLEGVSTSFASWATTDFMIALALGFPPARWLAQRYGDLRAYVVAFIVFADASLACALSESLRLFCQAGWSWDSRAASLCRSGSRCSWKNIPTDSNRSAWESGDSLPCCRSLSALDWAVGLRTSSDGGPCFSSTPLRAGRRGDRGRPAVRALVRGSRNTV